MVTSPKTWRREIPNFDVKMCLNATCNAATDISNVIKSTLQVHYRIFHFKWFFQILTWHLGKLIHRNQHGPTIPKPSQQTATWQTWLHDPWPPPVCKGSASKASRLNCPLASCWSNILVRESLWTSLSRMLWKMSILDFHQVFLAWKTQLKSCGYSIQSILNRFRWVKIPSFLPIIFRKADIKMTSIW